MMSSYTQNRITSRILKPVKHFLLYIYIYIYTNLLPNSIYGDKEKEKHRQNTEVTIYLESLPGGGEGYREKKKKRKRPT